MVPLIQKATEIIETADIVIVIGTSLLVYPAAGLVNFAPRKSLKFVIDPNTPKINHIPNIEYIEEPATIGVPLAAERLKKLYE